MEKINNIPTKAQIQNAHCAIAPFIHRTPILSSSRINEYCGAEIYFKCENFQKIGAFKMRGATYATLTLTDEEKENGIATHSSGNHAQAVALSAFNHDIPAYVVMPRTAPLIKKNATLGYGAKIIECAPTIEDRQKTLDKIVTQTNATFIHPFNDFNVITGQSTAALEIFETHKNLDVIMAPIGGGGLMSGTCLTTHYYASDTELIGVEPMEVNDAFLSIQAGKIISNKSTNSIADGLLTNLGDKTFEILRSYINDILLVEEHEILHAMKWIYESLKIVIEPSCAVPLAAVFKNKERFKSKQIGIILTGGNVDLKKLPF